MSGAMFISWQRSWSTREALTPAILSLIEGGTRIPSNVPIYFDCEKFSSTMCVGLRLLRKNWEFFLVFCVITYKRDPECPVYLC